MTVYSNRSGVAGPADLATTGPMFDWDSICLQARSLRTICTDPCPHKHRGPNLKQSCGTWERADFERSCGIAWNMIWRLITKQNSNRLVCVAPSRCSQGAWSCWWKLISMCADVKWIRILLPCRTKAKISSDVLGPNSLRRHLIASNLKLNFPGGTCP